MQKSNRKLSNRTILNLIGIGLALLVLFLALIGPSEASGADKTTEEGYRGSERIVVVEKPVEGKSGVTRKQGWVGDKRIDLRVVRTNEYTETRGWEGDQYIHVKERKDD